MTAQTSAFAVRGAIMHAPACGEIEIFDDALISVDEAGVIASVLGSDEAGFARALEEAVASGNLETLAEGQYLLPGLVDTHVHAPQWPQMGNVLHVPLNVWLDQYTFPLEARYADVAFAEQVYGSLVSTLLANGTTTVAYYATIHRAASRRLAEICVEQGQRALVGKLSMDHPEQCPDYYREDSTAAGLEDIAAFIDDIGKLSRSSNGLVAPIITPRFIPSCTDDMLTGLGTLAAEAGCHVQTHVSEGDWEHNFVLERHGMTDTHSLQRFGLLKQQTLLAHCNFIDQADMGLIKETGAGIAHCPLANLYFSNAIFPVRRALDQGLKVGLGTDIAGGANPSILHNCQMAVTASRAREDGVNADLPAEERGTPGARIDFKEAFWMATAGGGQALDLKVGLFVPGYAFDAIVIDTQVPDTNLIIWDGIDTREDILQKIIYNAERRNISGTWVQGRRLKG